MEGLPYSELLRFQNELPQLHNELPRLQTGHPQASKQVPRASKIAPRALKLARSFKWLRNSKASLRLRALDRAGKTSLANTQRISRSATPTRALSGPDSQPCFHAVCGIVGISICGRMSRPSHTRQLLETTQCRSLATKSRVRKPYATRAKRATRARRASSAHFVPNARDPFLLPQSLAMFAALSP